MHIQDLQLNILFQRVFPGNTDGLTEGTTQLVCNQFTFQLPRTVAASCRVNVDGAPAVQTRVWMGSLFNYLGRQGLPISARGGTPQDFRLEFRSQGYVDVVPLTGARYRVTPSGFLSLAGRPSLHLCLVDRAFQQYHDGALRALNAPAGDDIEVVLKPLREATFPRTTVFPPQEFLDVPYEQRKFLRCQVHDVPPLVMVMDGSELCWSMVVAYSTFPSEVLDELFTLAREVWRLSGVPSGMCMGEVIAANGDRYPFNGPSNNQRKPLGLAMDGRCYATWSLTPEGVMFGWHLKQWVAKACSNVLKGNVEVRFAVLGSRASVSLSGDVSLTSPNPKATCSAWQQRSPLPDDGPVLYAPWTVAPGATTCYTISPPLVAHRVRAATPHYMPAVGYSVEAELPLATREGPGASRPQEHFPLGDYMDFDEGPQSQAPADPAIPFPGTPTDPPTASDASVGDSDSDTGEEEDDGERKEEFRLAPCAEFVAPQPQAPCDSPFASQEGMMTPSSPVLTGSEPEADLGYETDDDDTDGGTPSEFDSGDQFEEPIETSGMALLLPSSSRGLPAIHGTGFDCESEHSPKRQRVSPFKYDDDGVVAPLDQQQISMSSGRWSSALGSEDTACYGFLNSTEMLVYEDIQRHSNAGCRDADDFYRPVETHQARLTETSAPSPVAF